MPDFLIFFFNSTKSHEMYTVLITTQNIQHLKLQYPQFNNSSTFSPKRCVVFLLHVVVDFICQLDWAKDAQIAVKRDFWVCLWGRLQKRSAFGSADWVNIALTSVDGHRPICWGPEQNRKSKEAWIHSLSAWAEASIFSCPWTLDIGAPGSQLWDSDRKIHHQPRDSQAFGFRLNHTSGLPGSPACKWQRDWGTSCLP